MNRDKCKHGYHLSEACERCSYDSGKADGIREGMEKAAGIALECCLVPPDGGSPSESEVKLCESIAQAIRSAKEKL
jgi:hypothetical protein